jgi:hypothetical protein
MRIEYRIRDVKHHKENGLTPNEIEYYLKWDYLPTKFHLTFGKKYAVLGIDYKKNGGVDFLIEDDTEVSYPKSYPSEFFSIQDNQLSKKWDIANSSIFPIENIRYPSFVFNKEFLLDQLFFDKLLNGDLQIISAYDEYVTYIKNEYTNPEFLTGICIDDKWVQCAYCDNIWKNTSPLGVISCEANGHKNNNPKHFE